MREIKKPAANKSETIKLPVAKKPTPDINYPVFCFRYLARGFGIEDCQPDDQAALVKRLGKLSQLTWEEIRLSQRHGFGAEKIARTSIRGPIPPWVTADIDFFLAFRFHGKKPFVGHKQDQVFHILWIDHSFEVYKH